MEKLIIESEPIGKGKERVCYLHPADPAKLIKISWAETNIQSKREVDYYKKLSKRPLLNYTHIPRFYGEVKTNLGDGFVVDLVTDYNGDISRSLQWYFQQGDPLVKYDQNLADVHAYLYDNEIIFNDDISAINLLLQKTSADQERLVVIDGIGDSVYIKWLNIFPYLVRKKIDRRWMRFYSRLDARFGSGKK